MRIRMLKKVKAKLTKELVTAWLISVGLVISVIHQPNQPLIEYIFLPQIGNMITILASFYYLLSLKREDISFGNKWVWIPLATITGLITLRPFYALFTGDTLWGMKAEWSGAAYGLSLFALYLVGRKLGWKMFQLFTPAVIIVSISTLPFFSHGIRNGGILSISNYDITAGFLIIGTLVSSLRSRWWLTAIAITGLFFIGAEEGLFTIVILLAVVLIRRDWSKKLLLPTAALTIILLVSTPLGITERLWSPALEKVSATKEATEDTPGAEVLANFTPVKSLANKLNEFTDNKGLITRETAVSKDELLNKATNTRWKGAWQTSPLKPLGYGYNINNFYLNIPHNILLIITEQIGVLGALAWLTASLWLMIKTEHKYIWAGFITLGVFDHYIWTQAAPWFWALAGASSSSSIANDYIFRLERR